MNIKDQFIAEIERLQNLFCDYASEQIDDGETAFAYSASAVEFGDRLRCFLCSLPEQPVSDHHEIEVEFRGEKVTISREFYRNGERNYSTGEQDDNAIWSALRAWCEKKGITPFELYPKQSEQPVEGLKEAAEKYLDGIFGKGKHEDFYVQLFKAGAEWQKKLDDLETADLLAIAHLQGMEQQKSKMMEEAVEGYVNYYEDSGGILMAEAQVGCPYHNGDKVKIIVIKEDEV